MGSIDRSAAGVGRICLGDVGALVLGPSDVLVEEDSLVIACATTFCALAAAALSTTTETTWDGEWRRGWWRR